MGKEIRKSAVIIALCIVTGYLLLSLSYLIPAKSMTDGAYRTDTTLAAERAYYVERYSDRLLDNFTDSIMLLTAEYPGDESAFDKAINAYMFNHVGAGGPVESYVDFHSGSQNIAQSEIITTAYAKYWHGYQLFLRPLISMMNYDLIRKLNTAVQFFLVIIVLLLMKRRAEECTFPFAIMLLFMAPTAIGRSLQYSSVYYVMLIVILLILWNPGNRLNDGNIIYLFLLSGVMTVYLDLLTAPTISLTAPLCVYCVLRRDDLSGKDALKMVIKCSFFWAAGYAGMWIGKWILAVIGAGPDFFNELLGSMKYRLSSTSTTQVTRAGTLRLNLEYLFQNKFVALFALIYALIMTAADFHERKKLTKHTLFSAGVLFAISIVPVAWIVILSNHSNIHAYFTYRTLCPAVFCMLTALSLNDSLMPPACKRQS